MFALITGGLGQDVTRLLTLGLGLGEAVVVPTAPTETYSGGWEHFKPRYRTREEIDAERRRLGILPPSVEVSVAKSAREAIAERKTDEKALRDAVEVLRAEVGKRKAAQLRQQYVAAVRLEMERELLRMRQEEEEVIAILAIQLLAA